MTALQFPTLERLAALAGCRAMEQTVAGDKARQQQTFKDLFLRLLSSRVISWTTNCSRPLSSWKANCPRIFESHMQLCDSSYVGLG
jgi:hypothetical protein